MLQLACSRNGSTATSHSWILRGRGERGSTGPAVSEGAANEGFGSRCSSGESAGCGGGEATRSAMGSTRAGATGSESGLIGAECGSSSSSPSRRIGGIGGSAGVFFLGLIALATLLRGGGGRFEASFRFGAERAGRFFEIPINASQAKCIGPAGQRQKQPRARGRATAIRLLRR